VFVLAKLGVPKYSEMVELDAQCEDDKMFCSPLTIPIHLKRLAMPFRYGIKWIQIWIHNYSRSFVFEVRI